MLRCEVPRKGKCGENGSVEPPPARGGEMAHGSQQVAQTCSWWSDTRESALGRRARVPAVEPSRSCVVAGERVLTAGFAPVSKVANSLVAQVPSLRILEASTAARDQCWLWLQGQGVLAHGSSARVRAGIVLWGRNILAWSGSWMPQGRRPR